MPRHSWLGTPYGGRRTQQSGDALYSRLRSSATPHRLRLSPSVRRLCWLSDSCGMFLVQRIPEYSESALARSHISCFPPHSIHLGPPHPRSSFTLGWAEAETSFPRCFRSWPWEAPCQYRSSGSGSRYGYWLRSSRFHFHARFLSGESQLLRWGGLTPTVSLSIVYGAVTN